MKIQAGPVLRSLFLWFFLVQYFQGKSQEVYQRSVVKEGIKLDFMLSHLDPGKVPGKFQEGDDVRFRFTIRDTISNKPLSGAFPAAWVDYTREEANASCGRRIVSYLEGSFISRPELDLNKYYVFTLNDDNTINVVDPLFSFGGSQLLSQITLKSTGYDWVINEDQSEVYVSMPEVSQLAFINTADLTVTHHVTVPGQPRKLLLQKDQRYLWVAYELQGTFEARSGVAVIDTQTRRLVKTIETGRGSHDLAIGKDDQYVFVSNRGENTLSVIDVFTLKKVSDIGVEDIPVHMAYSDKADALYVVNKRGARISVIDGNSLQVVHEIAGEAGMNRIDVTPDGRFAFILNPEKNTVAIMDCATNVIVQQADVEDHPDEVSFTDELAYVRHSGSETIWMIPLDVIGREGTEVPLVDFGGGQHPPSLGIESCGAPGIVQAPGANAVLVSNYLDQSIYYYVEGMAAPNGHFNTYGKKPKAVLVVDKSIEEVAIGVYETTAKLRGSGSFTVSLFLDVPSFMECFPVTILPNEELDKKRMKETAGPLSINYLSPQVIFRVGEEVTLSFELYDTDTQTLIEGLRDVGLMTMTSTGKGSSTLKATETETKGAYKTTLMLKEEGVHYVYVSCPSRGLSFNNPQFLVLYASSNDFKIKKH